MSIGNPAEIPPLLLILCAFSLCKFFMQVFEHVFRYPNPLDSFGAGFPQITQAIGTMFNPPADVSKIKSDIFALVLSMLLIPVNFVFFGVSTHEEKHHKTNGNAPKSEDYHEMIPMHRYASKSSLQSLHTRLPIPSRLPIIADPQTAQIPTKMSFGIARLKLFTFRVKRVRNVKRVVDHGDAKRSSASVIIVVQVPDDLVVTPALRTAIPNSCTSGNLA